VTWK